MESKCSNWIVCFQPIKFEKISDQPIRTKQASAYAGWRDMTRKLHRAVESIFRKVFAYLSRNVSDTNQNNQSGNFPVLQEEELER